MIRILKPNVLWFDGRRTHVKGAGDVLTADTGLEARWVAEGVAEYVSDQPEPAPAVEPDETTDQPDLASMTKAELEEVARARGIAVGRMTKAQLLSAIEESDEPPAISAAEAE